jgi:hypothetical protein
MQMFYLYNPINNVKTPTDYELLEGITGISKKNLAFYKCRHRKIPCINSYLVDENFTKEQLYEFMIKESPKDEIWKAVDKNYMISNYGRVKAVYKIKERLLIPYKKHERCLVIKIHGKETEVHKLVANAFLDIEPGKCIYHKDENKYNNHADNLGFATRSELGKKFGHKSNGVAVIKFDAVTGEELDRYENMAVAGRENYLSNETIRQAVAGELKTAGGFKWMIDEEFNQCKKGLKI